RRQRGAGLRRAEPGGEWGRAEPGGQRRAEVAAAASAVPGAEKWAGQRARGCGSARPGRAAVAEGARGFLSEGRSRARPASVLPVPLPRAEPGAAALSLSITAAGSYRQCEIAVRSPASITRTARGAPRAPGRPRGASATAPQRGRRGPGPAAGAATVQPLLCCRTHRLDPTEWTNSGLLQKASQNVVSSCSEPSCPFPWMVLCVTATCHRSHFPF
ncbi:hypothetical protein DV515_00015022, partial [Chloebia gouldiae]